MSAMATVERSSVYKASRKAIVSHLKLARAIGIVAKIQIFLSAWCIYFMSSGAILLLYRLNLH